MIESIVRVESVSWGGFSVSGCEVGLLGEFVEGGLVGAGCGTQSGWRGRVWVGDLG